MSPYLRIAEVYDAEMGGLEADLAYFSAHGEPGPLLVVGCGTGRVSEALARLRPTTGLDLSEDMLALARRRGLARYVHGDMRAFELGLFAEVLVPNASFNFLLSRADQRAALACFAAALPPDGRLTLDMPMPDWGHYAQAHTPERPAWEGWVQGQRARRTREVWRWPAAQRLDLLDRYFLDEAPLAEVTLRLRLVLPAEAEWMLEGCGFWVEELLGDYQGGPAKDHSPRVLVRARKI